MVVMSACGHADMRADEIEYGLRNMGFEVAAQSDTVRASV
jgi:hypothetical protein